MGRLQVLDLDIIGVVEDMPSEPNDKQESSKTDRCQIEVRKIKTCEIQGIQQ